MKESETLEFKKSTSELKEAIISMVAILNKHKKGEVYFGIKNNGEIFGQEIGKDTLRKISKTISDNIEPKIFPKIEEVKIDGRICVKVEFEGRDAPYFAYGRVYVRSADEDRKISAKELENFILSKNKEKMRWDNQVCEKAELKEIDEEILKEYLEKTNQAKRINFSFTNKEDVLKKLELMSKKKITNACNVLFSNKRPLELQAAVFAGKDKTTFLDIKQEKGNIFELLRTSESYIKEHINWRADLSGSKRIEIPEIPLRAIKEALVNSFCHRDFKAPESNKIAVYKNRVSIWNPGNFPEGYKPEDFIEKETPSILRNPLVANVLYLSQDIEKWGSGLKRIYGECEEAGVKVEFRKEKYGFSVVFYRILEESGKKIVGKTVGKTVGEILDLINKNPSITREGISKETGLSVRGVEWNLAKLKEKGLIKRVGSAKGGHWEVLK